MNSSSSGKRPEGSLTGKGFYIVLFLCAAVIGVSAWVMAAGNGTMQNENSLDGYGGEHRVEMVIAPAPEDSGRIDETEFAPPEIGSETMAMPDESASDDPQSVPAAVRTASVSYIWPTAGVIERDYSVAELKFDQTMQDWRTHGGIDIAAEEGSSVVAVRGGRIESVVNDSLLGTVLTIDHGDGIRSVYANLAPETSVRPGEWVDPGVPIGTVGHSALCEIGQNGHLHFEMRANGAAVDPMAYLPT